MRNILRLVVVSDVLTEVLYGARAREYQHQPMSYHSTAIALYTFLAPCEHGGLVFILAADFRLVAQVIEL